MEKPSEKPERRSLEVIVELKDLTEEQGWPDLMAYAYSRCGRFLERQPLERDAAKPTFGRANFELETLGEEVVVKIGPAVEVLALPRHTPVVRKVQLKARQAARLSLPIFKSSWWCWLKVPYIVTGTVVKRENGSSAPICVGEVDIYDVDVGYCLLRLPPLVIERIRDSMIDIVVNPPPVDLPEIPPRLHPDPDDWCGTGSPKPPFPPAPLNLARRLEQLPPAWAFARQRLTDIETARPRMNAMLAEMKPVEKGAYLSAEALEGVPLSKILYSNTAQFRELLIESFPVFRFWLCWYPWIYWYWWPWCWYSLEKLGTATLQPDGSFTEVVWLSICRQDTPDLWFVVRQNINGAERVIYARHPVPCNTYWNHPSGKPVHLIVTDPAAVACQQSQPVDIPDPYVMPMGIYEDEWYEIHQAHIKPPASPDAACGLYQSQDPYGTRLDLRMQFHPALRTLGANGVRYYRWSYRPLSSTGTPTPIDTPIAHRHVEWTGGNYVIKTETLGPDTVGTESNLFAVPDPTKAWLFNRNDLAFAIWYTATWGAQGGGYVKQVPDGKYELCLEMFDKNGAKVTPAAAGFQYILPTAAEGVTDHNLHVQTDGTLILNLHVDNSDTVADIKSVALSGAKAQDCQFLEYKQATDTVDIEYVAYHPNGFLDHRDLGVSRGISGTSVYSNSSSTPALPAAPATQSITVQTLLRQVGGRGPYTQCAFSIDLHTWPRTRDGHGRIRAYEAHDNSAFTLLKE